jgi:hypothetical protein
LWPRAALLANAIFSPGRGDEMSNLSEEFPAPIKIAGEIHPGINFEPADKSPGSRKRGYVLMGGICFNGGKVDCDRRPEGIAPT